jgi:dihydrofolate synthase/folylpolyglutamate synthase
VKNLLTYLYGLERRGIKVGLDHTEQLLEKIGNPHFCFPSIHVSGTNGKGSTCAMIASIFREANLKIGLYTSPHLLHFNERIRVNGIPISDEDIIKFVKRYRDSFDDIPVTFFEATTALAFWYFKKSSVDIAVIETGLGGRLDSTNVLSSNLAVITPISLDHQHLLGRDLRKIASEKGGIIKYKIPVVIAPQDQKAAHVLQGIASQNKSICCFVKSPTILKTDWGKMETRFRLNNITYTIPFLGSHQAVNAATAIQSVSTYDSMISTSIIKKGLDKTIWPGRLQKMDKTYPIFYDVAHNAHGLKAILETFNSLDFQKPLGLFCSKKDKNLKLIALEIKNNFSELITVSNKNGDLFSSSELNKQLKSFGTISNPNDNIHKAYEKYKHRKDPSVPILIFGSHYIARDVFDIFDFFFDSGII